VTSERVQKIIARSGLCSRREADEMVRDGRVTINGQVAQPGDTADPQTDHVKVDGKRLRSAEAPRHLLLYKPREVMSTCHDPEERTTVLDLVRATVRERVFPVGRLDYHSEGLILLTNDGELAAQVTHPRFGVVREYLVKIRGDLSETECRKLMGGTVIEGHRVRPLSARRQRVNRDTTTSWWVVEIAEGRTHEVRELFFRAGHHVQRLRRTAIGPIRDRRLKAGQYRPLTEEELGALRSAVRGESRRPASTSSEAPRSRRRTRPGRS
jgi:23S rRNA pseudouridine2605 synthase